MSSARPTPQSRPPPSAPPNSPHTEERQGYRRGRAIRSCLECRRRKMRCNRSRPCQNCNRFCRECVYLPFPEWPSGAPANANEEGKTQSADQAGGRAHPSFDFKHHTGPGQDSPLPYHSHGGDSYTAAKYEGTYDNDADDESLDFVLQVGRLSAITEKVGRFWKPLVTDQVSILHTFRSTLLLSCHAWAERFFISALMSIHSDRCITISDRLYSWPTQSPNHLWYTSISAINPQRDSFHSCSGQTTSTSRASAWRLGDDYTVFSPSARTSASSSR